MIPADARRENIRNAAQADDIKVKLDDALESLETKYSDKLKGLLPHLRRLKPLCRQRALLDHLHQLPLVHRRFALEALSRVW